MGTPIRGDGTGRSARHGRVLFVPALLAAYVASLVAAPSAPAAFHEMKIREVYSGTASNSSYLVLQMYSPGQNVVGSHSVTVYDASASSMGTFEFSGNVANGQNQRTILVGDDGVQAAFGLMPDLESSAFDIPALGGAACFESIDCVSWGTFSGSVLSPTGTPVSPAGISTGMAIRRTISGGSCSNQLDAGDDSNDSSADFTEQSPHPRNNASAIEEGSSCTPPTATDTTIGSKPAARTKSTEATFTFTGSPSDPGMTFECRLDGEPVFSPCVSPKTYAGLAGGPETSHTFRVRAIHPTYGTDATPATHTWVIDTVAPTITITDQPANPSPGGSAAFAYEASETVTATQCRLDTPAGAGTFEGCPPGSETYTGLADGLHTFMVHATDLAGNQSTPASFPAGTYSWTVDNSLADTTPPQTTIVTKPPDPSESSTASFTYESNEPGSTFACSLDGGAFVACPVTGVTYQGLGNGAHSLQVRATDESANTDPTPAGHSWSVSLPATSPPPPPPPPPDSDPAPGTAFAAGVAGVRGAVALLMLRCRGERAARCAGALRLRAQAGGARGSRKAARPITIGRRSYRLPADGRLHAQRVRLTRLGARLVRRAGRRGLRARLVGRRLRNRTVTLLPAGGSRRSGRATRR